MSQGQINRRQLVRAAAGVAAGGVLVGGTGVASASAHDDHAGRGAVGTWVVDHTDDPPAEPSPGRTLVSLAPGGVLVGNDIKPPGPGATGSWATTSHNRFKATAWGGIPGTPGGDPDVTLRLKIRGKVQGDMVTGTYRFTVFAPDDSTLFEGTGKFTGTRLEA